MKRFAAKVAILIASSSGIGRATAIAFAREGANVIVACRRRNEGEETVRMQLNADSHERPPAYLHVRIAIASQSQRVFP